ncbi:MAG: CDP-diacylglycerol--glycerol-3-phosphate 3-phosphatidyltransferase [Nitrospirota bacterium]
MTLANKITISRILLIPVFIIFLVYGYRKDLLIFRHIAFGIFILSILTDALDGMVARAFKQQTNLGSFLDPLADKLLLISAFIVIGYVEKISVGVVILVVSRDVIMALGWIILQVFNSNTLIIKPSILGKLTTVLQMLTIICCLIEIPYPIVIRYTIITTMVIFTICSTLHYIYAGSRMLNGKEIGER